MEYLWYFTHVCIIHWTLECHLLCHDYFQVSVTKSPACRNEVRIIVSYFAYKVCWTFSVLHYFNRVWMLSFLAELLSALWLEIFRGWNLVADDVQTTCGRRADDVRTTWERDFVGDFSWRMTYVVRTSSGRHPHMHTSSAHRLHIVCTSSARHLHHSSWSAWAWTIFYCDRNLLFDGICGKNVELFHFMIM